MLNLVFHAKDAMQRELLAELYKPDMIEEMLKESDSVVQRRKECIKMVSAPVHVPRRRLSLTASFCRSRRSTRPRASSLAWPRLCFLPLFPPPLTTRIFVHAM